MSMIVQLLRVRASRREQQREATRAQERAELSPQAIQSRRYRRVLAVVLFLIGAVALVEVVLVPGSMIRRNLTSGATNISAAQTPEQEPQLPGWLMTEDQKAKVREQHIERLEQTLRATHLKLGNACIALTDAHVSLSEYSEGKLHVVPGEQMNAAGTSDLVDVVANEPTGKVAWTTLVEVSKRADTQLRDARELLAVVSARFTAGSFLVEDDQDMKATIQQLEQTCGALTQARSCIEHIDTLQRGRAALAHQASLDATTGGSK